MLAFSATLDYALPRPDHECRTIVCSDDVSILGADPRFPFTRVVVRLFQVLAIVIHGLDSSYGALLVAAFLEQDDASC